MLKNAGGEWYSGCRCNFSSRTVDDHYDPANKTVNLSEAVYMQRNAAAAAVAAHECGHAIQHAEGYSMLRLRSKLVPVVNISSRLLQFVLFAGSL